jgi:hypothetical protein
VCSDSCVSVVLISAVLCLWCVRAALYVGLCLMGHLYSVCCTGTWHDCIAMHGGCRVTAADRALVVPLEWSLTMWSVLHAHSVWDLLQEQDVVPGNCLAPSDAAHPLLQWHRDHRKGVIDGHHYTAHQGAAQQSCGSRPA